MSTKISIVVPFRNVPPKYFKAHLESLAAQDCVDCEFIYVDDQSTDTSPDLAKAFVTMDSRFKYILAPEWGSNGGSREVGYHHASGEYIWFIDADDQLIGSNVLSVVLKLVRENGFPDALLCEEEHHAYINAPKHSVVSTPITRLLSNHTSVLLAYQQGDAAVVGNSSPHNKVFKRSFLLENRFSCAKQAIQADIIFVITLALCHSIVVVNDTYYQVINMPTALGKSPYGRAEGCEQHFRLAEHTHAFYLDHKEAYEPIASFIQGYSVGRHLGSMRFMMSWQLQDAASRLELIARWYELLVRMLPHYPILSGQSSQLQPILDVAYKAQPLTSELERTIESYFMHLITDFEASVVKRLKNRTLQERAFDTLPRPVYAWLKRLVKGTV
jgi:glycosyltransferase involved in cell wall biosynthesis